MAPPLTEAYGVHIVYKDMMGLGLGLKRISLILSNPNPPNQDPLTIIELSQGLLWGWGLPRPSC